MRLVRARVILNGRRLRVVQGRRLARVIVLRKVPRGRFKIKVTVTTSTGRKLTATQRYRRCR